MEIPMNVVQTASTVVLTGAVGVLWRTVINLARLEERVSAHEDKDNSLFEIALAELRELRQQGQ